MSTECPQENFILPRMMREKHLCLIKMSSWSKCHVFWAKSKGETLEFKNSAQKDGCLCSRKANCRLLPNVAAWLPCVWAVAVMQPVSSLASAQVSFKLNDFLHDSWWWCRHSQQDQGIQVSESHEFWGVTTRHNTQNLNATHGVWGVVMRSA